MSSASELKQLVTVLSNRTGLEFFTERSYGSPQLYVVWAPREWRPVSPRLPAGQLVLWVKAFMDGMDFRDLMKLSGKGR